MKLEKRSGAYFVAKNQEIFGPISTSELEGMRKAGQLSGYSWICKEDDTSWTAIDPAPDHLPFSLISTSSVTIPAVRPFQVRETRISTAPFAKYSDESFRGILFDSRNAVTAWVSEASAGGCEIRSDSENSDPLFVHGAGAVLNLHEVETGKTSNVAVHVDEILRSDGQWVYRVRWSHVPALFDEQKAS